MELIPSRGRKCYNNGYGMCSPLKGSEVLDSLPALNPNNKDRFRLMGS